MSWKDTLYQLARGKRLVGAKVRHGLSFVSVSNIHEQYYCELRVENRYLAPPMPKPKKQEGTNIHGIILGSQNTTLKDTISKIETLPVYTTSFPTVAKYKDVVIVGRPDAVLFLNSKPTLLIELKTTSGDPLRLWQNHVVQAGIYGFLMEEMGFNCSNLQLGMVRLRREADATARTKHQFIHAITSSLLRKRTKDLERIYLGNVRCDCLRYDRKYVLHELDWILGYWLLERQPIATRKASVCSHCEFDETCSETLKKDKK